ncbi:glycosyltransferase family 4 protein [Variovorax sp. HJSM1_2]|uniref:glycosyltransferase family 4 protein n=1 Tax=Variovorax sp. HJSM1_2 TaxID=3366263 RepID=UPI003BE17E5E
MNELIGLRVGLVGPLPPPAGGMANQARQLAELLNPVCQTVAFVQTNAPYPARWIERLPVVRAGFRLLPYLWKLWRTAGEVDVLHIMANSGWSWHLFAAPAIWIAWLRHVPVIVNYRGGEAADFLQKAQRIVQCSMSRVAVLAVPSGFLQAVFGRFGMSATVLPNIIDLTRFSPRGGRDPMSAHVIVARNLEPLYDNTSAIRAFQQVQQVLPRARLTIAGSGPEAEALQALVTALGLEKCVTFTGRLDRDAMARLFRDADVMLNPSLADNMPNSVLEAMASGVPVVSTNVGGVPYLVEDGKTALLVPPSDPAALASASLRLLQDEQLWTCLQQAGLAQVQRYTWANVAPVLGRLYRQAQGKAKKN